MWPTPAARDLRSGKIGVKTSSRRTLLLNEAAHAWTMAAGYLSSRPGHGILGGQGYLPTFPITSPRFVEWMMGLPSGWSSSTCSATELYLSRQRMRFRLSWLKPLRQDPQQQLAFRH